MFKTAATKIAHNSTIPALAGNKDLRPLQDLITAEKSVIVSLQRLSADYVKASEALRIWGSGEGEDLGDTLSASTTLLAQFATALSQYATHGHPMREYLKSIRTREENLDELKRRRKALSSKADTAEKKLGKMSPEHKNLHLQTDSLNVLRAEIRSLDSDIMTEEALLGDFKRTTTRQWMGLKFGALLECSEKGTIVGEYGKQVIAEIPEETTQPGMARSLYYGHLKTQSLVSEAHRCISEVHLSTSLAPGPSLSLPTYPPGSSTTQLSYQGSGGPSTPTSVGFQPHDFNPPGGAPPHYLPPQKGLGTGQFFDPIPPSPHEPVPPRSVDDFGVNMSPSPAFPNGPDGRFATFPEKRPGGIHGGYALRDNPPSLGASHEASGSFSSSVADTLGPLRQASTTSTHLGSIREPAPNYDAPTYEPLRGQSSWSATHTQGNPSNASQGDAVLAYTAMEEHQIEGHGQGLDDDRHVRFGQVSDVDEEIERRGGPHQPPSSPGQQHAQPSAMRNSSDSARDPPHTNEGQSGVGSSSQNQQFSSQQQVQPPAISSEDEERELNAAAAREVSREMDALTFNPPVSSLRNASPDPSAVQHSRGPGFGGSSTLADMSPLAPPSAPFAHRSPSPHPIMDSVAVPPYPGASPSITPAQVYAEAHMSSNSLEHSSPLGPRLNTPATPAMHLTDDGAVRLSPLSTHTPYQTPPEYQRNLSSSSIIGTGSSPTPNFKSISSSNLGPRTISAAAFKRAPQRKGTGELPMVDTSPLSLKKRLPSSPYPQHRDPSPMGRSASLPPLLGDPSPHPDPNVEPGG